MYATLNGRSLNYQTAGERGPWVVLNHALSANLSMWDPQVAELARSNRVLCFDARGHGESDAPEAPCSMEDLADDVCRLMDHVGIENAFVVGLSLGGAIALTVALQIPERVYGLVIADATSAYPAGSHAIWQQRIEQVREGGMAAIVDGTLGRWFTDDFSASNPDMITTVRKMILGTHPEGFIRCVEAIKAFNVSDRLREIRCPTYVVVGSEDRALPPEHSERIRDGIPGARLEVIPDAAHISNLEQPRTFTAGLQRFITHCPILPKDDHTLTGA